MGLKQFIQNKGQKAMEKTVGKAVEKASSKMSLPQQVKLFKKYLSMGYPLANARRDLINGIEDDFKKGKRTLEYYSGCPEFMVLWKELGMDIDNLKVLGGK